MTRDQLTPNDRRIARRWDDHAPNDDDTMDDYRRRIERGEPIYATRG